MTNRKPRTKFSHALLNKIGFSADARQGAHECTMGVALTGNESDDYLLGYDYMTAQIAKNAPAAAYAAKQSAGRAAQDQF